MVKRSVRYALLALVAVGAVAVAGCASAQPPAPAPNAASVTTAASPTGPSATALIVCSGEAREDLADALGVQPTQPPTSTWADALFTCRYPYKAGTLTLTVKELADSAGTQAYLASARTGLGKVTNLAGIGEEAFAGPDGSVYVRKDFKVLHVDVSGLPETFGQPAYSRSRIGITVAEVIMSCWTGG